MFTGGGSGGGSPEVVTVASSEMVTVGLPEMVTAGSPAHLVVLDRAKASRGSLSCSII